MLVKKMLVKKKVVNVPVDVDELSLRRRGWRATEAGARIASEKRSQVILESIDQALDESREMLVGWW
jgi:hypothetical protein